MTTQIRLIDENIREEPFEVILPRAYAEYMAATVMDRAIPDARDGLKPVQRRILYCMYINGFRSTKSTIKSAKIVGQVTGEYHPHGDVAIYDTMARMAQDFTMRYRFIDGQGNFGSIDGDPAAASRYTEARLSALAEVLLADVDQETVPLIQTYLQDPRYMEPLYLTGHLPPVVNPIQGLAVALSTSVPPHNLGEVLGAATALLDKPGMNLKELMRYIQGPDFPTGGQIVGEEGVLEYLATGKGRFTLRGTVRLEEGPKGQALVITEIPYGTKDKIKESMAKAINERKVEGVADLRDESDDDHGLRIVLSLRKDADPSATLNALYQYSNLQQNYSAQMVFLMGQPGVRAVEPRQVGMLEILNHWNGHQLDVLTKRLEHELRKARERLHVVQGLIIGAANAQQIVKIFQQAADRAAAKEEIKRKYKLTEIQAEVIAAMTLSQVTKLDAGHYEEERKTLEARIAEIVALLADRDRLVALLKSEYKAVKDKHTDPRRTRIDGEGAVAVVAVQNIIEEKVLRVLLAPDGTLRANAVEGRRKAKKDYAALALFDAKTTDYVLFVSDQGKVYALRGNKLPETNGKGESLRKLLSLEAREQVVAALAVPDFVADQYLVQFTRNGKVKKSALAEYRGADAAGLADMKMLGDDRVVTAFLSDGTGHLLVLTADGKGLRFANDEVRASGRVGQGVAGVSLGQGATVLAAFPVAAKDKRVLVTVTQEGYAKRTALDEYPPKGRATGGVQACGLGAKDGLAAATPAKAGDDLLLWTARGEVARLETKKVASQARGRRGTRLAVLATDDAPAGLVVARD